MLGKKLIKAAAGNAGGAAGEATYIEDVFSTYLYTGTGQPDVIDNGIALNDGPTNGVIMHLTGDSIADSSPVPSTIATNVNVTVNTSIKKYGTGSLYFDGTAKLLTSSNHTIPIAANKDFTVEAWVYPTSIAGGGLNCVATPRATSGAWYFGFYLGKLFLYDEEVSTNLNDGTIALNTWQHIAYSREGRTHRIFLNGVLVDTVVADSQVHASSIISVGSDRSSSSSIFTPYVGYLDDFRVTKGVALYTANFTPPTSALPIDTEVIEGQGGLVWIKNRDQTDSHILTDTDRGATEILVSNTTAAEATDADTLTAFNSDGFALGADVQVNTSTEDYVSWTFRKAPKFFDVVTYTGTGSARTVSHNLGSVPGCIIVKRTDTTGDWQVYHRANTANPETDYLVLNSTAATVDSNTRWNDTAPTDSVFTVGTEATVNASGGTYVAYLFAHDAGGFGDDGEQNVISCGSAVFSAGVAVDLGWEPQWLLVKNVSSIQDWYIIDNMRSWTADGTAEWLIPSTAGNLSSGDFGFNLTPTGFVANSGSGITYIYIAIRRGPMKTPTSGTEVFAIDTGDNDGGGVSHEAGFVVDMALQNEASAIRDKEFATRLTGAQYLESNNTNAEQTASPPYLWDNQIGVQFGYDSAIYMWMFRRAPGFFDVVCWTGDSTTNREIAHNLGVTPELIITKRRNSANAWYTYHSGNTSPNANWWFNYVNIDGTGATAGNTSEMAEPTSTYIKNGSSTYYNASGTNYIAYLFATLAGVSKVGSYTGTGTTLAIDCGFSAGARFVMIKRTDSPGDWYVWDSARGIVSGNDPYLLLNSSAAEVTSTDYIDPSSAGFEISSTAPAAINASGGSFIFLAIA